MTDTIESLRAERDALKSKLDGARGVIAPFAREYLNWGNTPDDERPAYRARSDDAGSEDTADFTVGDLRRASEFIQRQGIST